MSEGGFVSVDHSQLPPGEQQAEQPQEPAKQSEPKADKTTNNKNK